MPGKIREMVSLLKEVRVPGDQPELAFFGGTLDVLERVAEQRTDPNHWLRMIQFVQANRTALGEMFPSSTPLLHDAIMRDFYGAHFAMAEAILKKLKNATAITPEAVIEAVRGARDSLGLPYEQYLGRQLQSLKSCCTQGRSLEKLLTPSWARVIADMEKKPSGSERVTEKLDPVQPDTFRGITPFWLLMSKEAQVASLQNMINDGATLLSPSDVVSQLSSHEPLIRGMFRKKWPGHSQSLEAMIGAWWGQLNAQQHSELKTAFFAHNLLVLYGRLSPEAFHTVMSSIPLAERVQWLHSLEQNSSSAEIRQALSSVFQPNFQGDSSIQSKNWEVESQSLADEFMQLLVDSMRLAEPDQGLSEGHSDVRMKDPNTDMYRILYGGRIEGLPQQPLAESTSSQKILDIQSSLKIGLNQQIAEIKEAAWNIVKSAIERGKVPGATISENKKYCIVINYNRKTIEVFFEPYIKQVAWIDGKRTRGSSWGPQITDMAFRVAGANGAGMTSVDAAFLLGWTNNMEGKYLYTKVPGTHWIPTLLRNIEKAHAGVGLDATEKWPFPETTVVKTTHLTQIVPAQPAEVGEDGVPKTLGTAGCFLFRQYTGKPRLRVAIDSSGAMIFAVVSTASGNEVVYCQKDGKDYWAYMASDQKSNDVRTGLAASNVINEVNQIGEKVANGEQLTEKEQDLYADFFQGMVQLFEVELVPKNEAKTVLASAKAKKISEAWGAFHKKVMSAMETQTAEFLQQADLAKTKLLYLEAPRSKDSRPLADSNLNDESEQTAMSHWLESPSFRALQDGRYDLFLQALESQDDGLVAFVQAVERYHPKTSQPSDFNSGSNQAGRARTFAVRSTTGGPQTGGELQSDVRHAQAVKEFYDKPAGFSTDPEASAVSLQPPSAPLGYVQQHANPFQAPSGLWGDAPQP